MTMTQHEVSKVIDGGNGISTFLFKSGSFVVVTDKKHRFYNRNGRGLCSAPESRYSEACHRMAAACRAALSPQTGEKHE